MSHTWRVSCVGMLQETPKTHTSRDNDVYMSQPYDSNESFNLSTICISHQPSYYTSIEREKHAS